MTVTTCWVQVAKGNVKNASITACAWGYQCRANPACLDTVSAPWGPWLGKWGPLTSPEPVSVFRKDKNRMDKSRRLWSWSSVWFSQTSLLFSWVPGGFLDMYINCTKVIIWIITFPLPIEPRGIWMMNCEILPHHPSWMMHVVSFISSSWILHCSRTKLSILTKATAGKSQELTGKNQ